MTVWLTGLPAAGKSTIARALAARLVAEGRAASVLDGDELRRGLSSDLGFADPDRAEHVRRVGHVARLLADAGIVAVVAVISPFAAGRRAVRELHAAHGVPFVEVFVDTPVAECARRDPKGLYARARAGAVVGLTGVDAPYEAPAAPEVRVETTALSVDAAVDRILAALEPPAGEQPA